MLRHTCKTFKRIPSGAAAAVLLIALAGCLREDENTQLMTGPDDVVTVVPVGTPAFLRAPDGDAAANQLELISFDPAALDAFGRATSRDATVDWPHWNFFFGGGEWSVGRSLGLEGFLVQEEDPRSPAVSWSLSDIGFEFFWMFMEGNAFGIGHNWFGEVCCAPPGELLVMGLVRAGVVVNGEVDQNQILQGQAVDQPDELVMIDVNQGGDVTFAANKFATRPAPALGDNPFIIGTLQACPASPPYLPYDATCAALGAPDGDVIIDFVFSSTDAGGNPVFPTEADPTAGNSPLAPNELVRFGFPSYNYLMLWHTNPDGSPDFSRPFTRLQLGVDLSELGGPINNAFAPFPTAALSDAELATGRGAESRPDRVKVRYSNLEELRGSNVYKVWALMRDGSTQALDFTYAKIRELEEGEDTVTAPAAASSFKGGGEFLHEVDVEFPDNATHIFLTVESGPGAGSASDVQPLWTPGLQAPGAVKSLDLPTQFGVFAGGNAANQRAWAVSGTGKGGLFGDGFRVRYQHLPRPPTGYKYVGWLSSDDSDFTRLPDGTFTSPPPEFTPLDEADVNADVSPVVKPLEILDAMTRFEICVPANGSCQQSGGPFELAPRHDTFLLTLEPKSGLTAMPSPTRVLVGGVPQPAQR